MKICSNSPLGSICSAFPWKTKLNCCILARMTLPSISFDYRSLPYIHNAMTTGTEHPLPSRIPACREQSIFRINSFVSVSMPFEIAHYLYPRAHRAIFLIFCHKRLVTSLVSFLRSFILWTVFPCIRALGHILNGWVIIGLNWLPRANHLSVLIEGGLKSHRQNRRESRILSINWNDWIQ